MRSFLSFLTVFAHVSAALTWQNVRIGGGGGFVPGIVFHPSAPGVAYARTDIGGLYRLNSDDSWTPVTDTIADNSNWNRWGIDAVALDPQDPDKVFAAIGMYTNSWDPNPGSIIRSNDRGETWTITNLPFKVGGNMPGRGMGERLAVDPINSNVLYFGARSGNGLWKSTDGGLTFQLVESFTAKGTFIPDPSDVGGYNGDIQGLAFVTFDSTSDVISGTTSRIFVGTADNTTASVYVSEDAGQTWQPIPGQPGTYFPHKCRLQPEEKALYLTYSDGTGPYDGTLGAVYRYDIALGVWTDITPVSGGDLYYGFGGLSVDMKKPGTVVVASLNSWWPDAQLFRTQDSGATWSRIWEWAAYPEMTLRYGISTTKAPWIKKNFLDVDSKRLGWMIESLEIDPTDSDHWLYGTGLTVFGGHDLTNWDSSGTVTIESLADGIEETSVQEVKSIPGGSELLVAVGDDSGFTFSSTNDLQKAPERAWDEPMFSTSTSVDYAGGNPNTVVRVGNTEGSIQMALSYDGGKTWSTYYGASTSLFGGTVAISANADTLVWSTSTQGVVRSKNAQSFSRIQNLPAGSVVVSDKKENAYFYASSGNRFYVSTDGAASFAEGGTMGVDSIRDIAVHPTVAGELFVSTNSGIFHSTNFGSSFALLSDAVTNVHQITLGLASDNKHWSLYAFGTGPQGPRLYASSNLGQTWRDIQGSEQTFGAIDSCKLTGSANSGGVVYVGTNGRGVLYTTDDHEVESCKKKRRRRSKA